MSETKTLQARLDELMAFIENAIVESESNKHVELSDLDKNVGDLCADVQAASPQDAKALQPAMGSLISKLDELEQALRASQSRNDTL